MRRRLVATLTLNPALDVSADIEALAPERKLRCRNPRWDPGGGGINVARVLRRLGERPLALFPCGGAAGERVCAMLDGEGVRTQAVPIAGDTREDFTAHELATGRQYRFVMPGPRLSTSEQAAVLAAVEALSPPPWALVLSGSLPPNVSPEMCRRLARWARRRRVRLALDASGPALKAGLEAGVWLVKPNLAELEELLGGPLPDLASRQAACRTLVASGAAQFVALSLGSEGALLASAAGFWLAEPAAIAPLSAVGAGDSFMAGLVWSFAREEAPEKALRWASAAATAALLAPGSELGRRRDIVRLAAQIRVVQIEATPAPAWPQAKTQARSTAPSSMRTCPSPQRGRSRRS